ncbi:putative clathrin assembly protein At1g25240 [Rutidosis leptorrhynchoides]|uniref:putative clathrin assembly protein At1g25240 n=1 Tax=Rutidosis leptorrhynchoides TaxID=125765 RepID=UPI003A98EC5B
MLKRASDALKDASSLFIANWTPRSSYRNPDIDAAVIKATSHNNTRIDYNSAQRIFAWIRVSSHYIRPILSVLSTRMERTHNWTVALKGLMLLHGIFSCKVPAIQKIGSLPFDLSNFKDRNPKSCHHEAFVRSYYTYLNKKSKFMYQQDEKEGSLRKGVKQKPKQSRLMNDLGLLQNLQCLLDMLLEIKPLREKMTNVLVLEAMDCIVIEIYDIYTRICNGIALVLVRLYSIGKTEAAIAFSVLQKAAAQAEVLSRYIELCRDFGVAKASESPKIVHICKDDIQALEHIIQKVSYQQTTDELISQVDKSVILREDDNITKTDSLRVRVT